MGSYIQGSLLFAIRLAVEDEKDGRRKRNNVSCDVFPSEYHTHTPPSMAADLYINKSVLTHVNK